LEKRLRKFTDVFKALEDSTRLRIINLLLNSTEPLCVVEIVESIDTPQYKVSKHLAILKNSGLIDYTRDGTWIYYSTALANEPQNILFTFLKNFLDEEIFANDIKKLNERLELRINGRCVQGYIYEDLRIGKQ
jgi:ArsR family transcriptional regulator, arsenate/arsenite/antimonite-responsive transcriptional repressor